MVAAVAAVAAGKTLAQTVAEAVEAAGPPAEPGVLLGTLEEP